MRENNLPNAEGAVRDSCRSLREGAETDQGGPTSKRSSGSLCTSVLPVEGRFNEYCKCLKTNSY